MRSFRSYIREASGPNRTVARVREAEWRANKAMHNEIRRISDRIAAGKAARGKADLTKSFGVKGWNDTLTIKDHMKDFDSTLAAVGTSRAEWDAKLQSYYGSNPNQSEKERKVAGKELTSYQAQTNAKILAPHARKIADAYMNSCIARGIDWTLVTDPFYGLKDIYTMHTGTPNERKAQHDAAALIDAVDDYMRKNSPSYMKFPAPSQKALHNLAVNIVRWVLENPS